MKRTRIFGAISFRIRHCSNGAIGEGTFSTLTNSEFAAKLTELRRAKEQDGWIAAAEEAAKRSPSFSFDEVADVANALAFGPATSGTSRSSRGLSTPWPELVEALLNKMPTVEEPSLQAARRSAMAMSRMGIQDEAWASCLAQHLALLEKSDELTEEEGRSLATLSDSLFALQGHLSDDRREAAWKGVAEGAMMCQGVQGAVTLARYMVSEYEPGDPTAAEALQAILKRAAQQADLLKAWEVALLLNAAARSAKAREPLEEAGAEASLVLMTLASRLAEHLRGDQGSPQDAANALDALGRLGLQSDELCEAFAEYLPNHLDQFGPKDVVGAATALGRLKERDEASLLAMAGLVSMDIHKYSIRQLADVLTAFARLRIRETNLLQNTMELCAGEAWKMQAYRPEDAVALLSAWGRLQAVHAEAIEETSRVLMRGNQALESLGATDLREVMVAYARSRWACQPMLQAAADQLTTLEGSKLYLLQMLAPALVALSRLRWPHLRLEEETLQLLLRLEDDLDSRDIARSVSLSAQALQGSALLGAGSLWLQTCEVVAHRLMLAGPDSVWAQLSSWKTSGALAPELWDEDEELQEVERERCWERELLFGVFVVAFTRRPSDVLGRGILASMPKLSAHVLLHLLLLQAEGLLQHPSLRPLCHTMAEALDASGIQAQTQVHESGYRGRQLPKEAHTVAKVLVRLGGFQAPEPLRRPWISRHASLGVHLLLPASWRLDDEGFRPEE